ncbi:MAG TPA: DinB family protein [Acidimicrobiales bacterium]|nr:DinB family protein [Acidimicrobiales bacterium]
MERGRFRCHHFGAPARHNGMVMTCSQCGFTYGAHPRTEVAVEIERYGTEFARRMGRDTHLLRFRPAADVWSALEYACHVRDVLLMQRDRLYVALVEDTPSFKPMYREERVSFDRYQDQDPSYVAVQIVMAARLFVNGLHGLSALQWRRPLMYGYPEPQQRDVEWMAHHTLHEAVHHLGDVDRQLKAA